MGNCGTPDKYSRYSTLLLTIESNCRIAAAKSLIGAQCQTFAEIGTTWFTVPHRTHPDRPIEVLIELSTFGSFSKNSGGVQLEWGLRSVFVFVTQFDKSNLFSSDCANLEVCRYQGILPVFQVQAQ
jgi:hypothetical protein